MVLTIVIIVAVVLILLILGLALIQRRRRTGGVLAAGPAGPNARQSGSRKVKS